MMIQNNEILDNIINNNTKNSFVNTSNKNLNDNNEEEVLITVSRVVSVRYKLYIVFILFFMFIFGYLYVLPIMDANELAKIELSNLELQLLDFENKRNQYESNKGLVDKIKQVDKEIISCVNDLIGCNELPLLIKNNFGMVRSYVLLNKMDNSKMNIDEKSILTNIDAFLLRKNKEGEGISNISNGILNKISIGDKQDFKDNLKFVPIELNITFLDKDGLLSFIDNVEKKIPQDGSVRMLYKIDQIGYDVVNSDKKQDVSIFMYLYFYEE